MRKTNCHHKNRSRFSFCHCHGNSGRHNLSSVRYLFISDRLLINERRQLGCHSLLLGCEADIPPCHNSCPFGSVRFLRNQSRKTIGTISTRSRQDAVTYMAESERDIERSVVCVCALFDSMTTFKIHQCLVIGSFCYLFLVRRADVSQGTMLTQCQHEVRPFFN